jgi:phosphate transport system substrate-binding protein
MKKTTTLALLTAALTVPAFAKAITVRGSDTMVIMNARLAEEFMKSSPGSTIQVTGGGSGVGIAALLNGTVEIAASSRPIRTSEVDRLKQRFATLGHTVAIAKDGLAVYVNDRNPIRELSLQQIQEIYTGKITNWSQVGGPSAPIILYSRENSSGTYVYFKDNVLRGKDYSPRAQTLQGTAAVVNAVAKDPNGIGYGGAAYGKGIRFVSVKRETNSPGYQPTLENVRTNQYPISRNLYFYLRNAPKGETKKFIDWILSPAGQQIVTQVGYFPAK